MSSIQLLLKALPQVLQNLILEFNPEHREQTRNLNTQFLKRDICQLNAQGFDVYNLNSYYASCYLKYYLNIKKMHSEFNKKLYCENCYELKDICYFQLEFCSSICDIQSRDNP